MPAKLFAFVSLFVSFAAAETPQTLAHWVRLTDGSLLVGRIESIDGEQLRIDLRLERETIVSVPRRYVAAVIVIPPVDPNLAEKYPSKNEKPNTIHLVGGEVLTGRLRSFSKGVFRFDLSIDGLDDLFIESQPIAWRRLRLINLLPMDKEKINHQTILLKNGSKLFCEKREDRENSMILIKNSWISELELPLSSLNFSNVDTL